MAEFHAWSPKKLVVVTHGLPAFVLRYIDSDNVSHLPLWDYSLDNASITWIKRGRVVWHGRNIYHEIDSNPEDPVYKKILENQP
jgi:hypothetical protein